MNQVRIAERKEHDALKGHKYTFLKNRENLSDKKEKELDELIKLYPTLGEAYRLKMLFNDLWEMPDKPTAEAFLRQWCDEVDAAKIPAFIKFANTVRAHWSGIVHFVESLITNGVLEGIKRAPAFFAKAEMGSIRFQQRKICWRLLPSAAPIRPASVPLRHINVNSMQAS